MKSAYLKQKRKYYQKHKKEHSAYYRKRGCCAICKEHQSEFNKSLHVDHNHSTGKVRGLLCYKCNAILGMLSENVEVLKEMINYIMVDNGINHKQKERSNA